MRRWRSAGARSLRRKSQSVRQTRDVRQAAQDCGDVPPEKTAGIEQDGADFHNGFSGYLGCLDQRSLVARKPLVFLAVSASTWTARYDVNRVLALTSKSTITAMMWKGSFAIRHVGDRQATAIEARSAHSFARHTHDEYGIGVMLAGAQRSWSGRGTVEAGAGDLITVNPGEVHDGTPIGESRTWAMLYLFPERMAAIAADIREGDQTDMEFVNPVLSDRRAADRFVAAYTYLTDDEPEAAGERVILLVAGLLHDKSVPRQVMQSPLAHVRARIDDDPASRNRKRRASSRNQP